MPTRISYANFYSNCSNVGSVPNINVTRYMGRGTDIEHIGIIIMGSISLASECYHQVPELYLIISCSMMWCRVCLNGNTKLSRLFLYLLGQQLPTSQQAMSDSEYTFAHHSSYYGCVIIML